MAANKKQTKRTYKNIKVELWEVENGFEIDLEWGISEHADCPDVGDGKLNFIAKNEKEAWEVVRDALPRITDDSGE